MKAVELNRDDYSLMQQASQVEKDTMGNYTYVDTAWNYFMNTEGSFLAVYDEEQMVGIAHLYVQPDRAGWFEALRITPEYQNKGAGTLLYELAIGLCKNKYHCTSLSMYTGRKNVRSSHLADKFGLTNVYDFKEYNYTVTGPKENHGFRYIDWQQAYELAEPLMEEYGDYLSVNRTWYRINEANIRMMADKAYCYGNDDGDFVITGTRFQHGSKLFVLMLGGDYSKGLDFAVSLAAAKNIPTVTCTFASQNEKLEKALQQYSFEFMGEIITKERIF